MVAIENDYFLVRFALVEDYSYAKFEGPWMILNHYLIVKEWHHNFDPLVDMTEMLFVWVCFPRLSIEYYEREFLMQVGAKIDRSVRVD